MAPIEISGDVVAKILTELGELRGAVASEGRTTRSRLEAQRRQIGGIRGDLTTYVEGQPSRCAAAIERAKRELHAELSTPRPPAISGNLPAVVVAGDVAAVPPAVPAASSGRPLLLGLGLVVGLVAGALGPAAWPAILAAILRAIGGGS